MVLLGLDDEQEGRTNGYIEEARFVSLNKLVVKIEGGHPTVRLLVQMN